MPQMGRAPVDQRVGCLQLLQGDGDQRTVRLGSRQHHASIGVARMNEHDAPPSDGTSPRIPDPPPSQLPVTPSGTDRSGWSQPPAPQSPGPPGPFVHRPPAPPAPPPPPPPGPPPPPPPPP